MSTQPDEHFGLMARGKSVLSSAFTGYLLSDHWRHGSIHPSLRATNFPVTLLNYLLWCCSQQFEHTGYVWHGGWHPGQSDRATWGKPVFSQRGRTKDSHQWTEVSFLPTCASHLLAVHPAMLLDFLCFHIDYNSWTDSLHSSQCGFIVFSKNYVMFTVLVFIAHVSFLTLIKTLHVFLHLYKYLCKIDS